MKHILLAIIAKNAESYLNRYLSNIYALDYPKKDITLYVRANNCTDQTIPMLDEWIGSCGDEYRKVLTDFSDVPEQVQRFGNHDWNPERFAVLGRIRQDAMEATLKVGADFYFCVDVDNYIAPNTLKELVKLDLPIVGPLLRPCKKYDNFVYQNIYAYSPIWYLLNEGSLRGVVQVQIVHCTYLVRADCIPLLSYLPDGTGDYEFLVFGKSSEKAGILHYVDSRMDYGCLETPWAT